MAKQAILIMVDTARQDMYSCYDKSYPQTANVDLIAKKGTMFTQAYTCQPVCGPARSAIFTGLFPHSNGMISNSMQLGANVKNAGEWLSQSQVECGYIGKWHLDGGDYFGYGKCPNGYNPNYWYDMRNFLDELTPAERVSSRKNMNARIDNPPAESTYANRCVDRAISFVEEFKENDFFLTLSLDEPHDPSVCPRKFMNSFKKYKFKRSPNVKASLKDKPSHQKVWSKNTKGLTFKMLQKGIRSILACNAYCDHEIGRLLEKVESLGLSPMIIYTADHGDMFLSHKIMGKGCVMYNEITRIPLAICGGGFESQTNSTPVSHIDLLPTVMQYLGVPIPSMLQGSPIQDVAKNTFRDIFMEFTRYEVDHDGFMGFQPIRCIFDGQHKLVINLLTEDELYDLKIDPYEKKNLILSKEYQKTRNALHDRLLEQMNITRDVHRGYYWAMRPWRKHKKASFKDTGYTRQLSEEDFTQLDYSTGMPVSASTRKK